MLANYLLSVLIWLPILGGVALLVIGDDGDAKSSAGEADAYRALAVHGADVPASIVAVYWLRQCGAGMQFVER